MRIAYFVSVAACCAVACGAELWEFTGEYCSVCREMEPTVAQLQREGVSIRRVDVQQNPSLAQQHGVSGIPCFLTLVAGQPFERLEGAASARQLTAMYERAQDADRKHSPNPSESSTSTTTKTSAEQRALQATVRLKVVDERGHSFGTGTVIDVHDDEALILTCGHIFRDSQGKGQVLCDLFGPGSPQGIPGHLIAFDARLDVGLVSMRPGVPVVSARVAGSGARPKEGEPVFAVGCNRGADPSVLKNRIISVNRYHGPANLVVGGRPVDGRSGGGLFNLQGDLIGVCNAADQEADEGLYAALGPIHTELDATGLGFIYRHAEPAVAQLDGQSSWNPNATSAGNLPTQLTLGQKSPAGATSQPWQPGKIRVPTADLALATEQSMPAARSQAEVIFIMRDSGSPGKTGQIYVLDRPSDALLRFLSDELSRRGPHVNTGLDVPARSGDSAPGRVTGRNVPGDGLWCPIGAP